MNYRYSKKRSRKKVPAIKQARAEVEVILKDVSIPKVITVKELSDKTGLPVVNLISELMKNGILAAINESIDFETAAIVCDDLGIKCELATDGSDLEQETKENIQSDKILKERPPVVTIMGHVDHGKTSLLDRIRAADVAGSESGGITQHISAYQVQLKSNKKGASNKLITFIDTPGHAAFSALRGHGASITDIVILIVAADDGVMPQTVEVIEQCKKHNVPIIIAINKVDLPDADVMKVKQQLSEYGLVPEDWGGKTLMIEISAKTGLGVESLLEVISLQADLMELKADYEERAFGVVIESHMHKGAGPLALVLVENGTLHKGDFVQIGDTWGRVRILENFRSQAIEQAGPSMPVRIAGLKDMPSFGEHLIAYGSEKEAKIASGKSKIRDTIKIATAKKINDENEESMSHELEYCVILKADVKGSLEALRKLIAEINSEEIKLKVVGEGIGAVSESDATLAKAINADVYAFRVPVLVSAKKISEKDRINIKSYDVIYELVGDIKDILSAMLPPEIREEELATGEVLAVFRNDKKGYVAGGKLENGKVSNNDLVRFIDGKEVIYDGKILSLRREKELVNDVQAGVEFGFGLEPGAKVQAGNKLTVYKILEINRTIK